MKQTKNYKEVFKNLQKIDKKKLKEIDNLKKL